MNEDYTQPFFVPYDMAKRLGWSRSGYLPALEPTLSTKEPEIVNKEWNRRQWDVVNQLRGLTLHLQRTVNEIKQSTPKEKERYVIKE